MRAAIPLILFLLILTPVLSVQADPQMLTVPIDPFYLTGEAKLVLISDSPTNCTHTSLNPNITYTLLPEPFEIRTSTRTIPVSVKVASASLISSRDLLIFECSPDGLTFERMLVAVNLVAGQTVVPNATETIILTFHEPLPYLYPNETFVQVEYPYFDNIGTGLGLDQLLSSVYMGLSVLIFRKVIP